MTERSCPSCHTKFAYRRILPVKKYTSQVYAIGSVYENTCLIEGCGYSGGQEWIAIGGISDIMEEIKERPLFVRFSPSCNWFQVPTEDGQLYLELDKLSLFVYGFNGSSCWRVRGQEEVYCHIVSGTIKWFRTIEGAVERITFEQALDSLSPQVQTKLLFHLDIFLRGLND